MSAIPPRRIGLIALRLVLAVTFVVAGAIKMWQAPEGFADGVDSFRLLPRWAVNPITSGLPWFEVLAGIMLLIARSRRFGAFCVLLLSTGFLLALAIAMVRGIVVDCGCFGSGPSWLPLKGMSRAWFDLVRDAALAAGALVLYRHDTIPAQPFAASR